MDSDFWTSRLAAAKRQFNLQQQQQNNNNNHNHNNFLHGSSHLDRMNIDDFEVVEDETRPDIPCPYCYEDFDIASLCTHLEDEHSCESRATVCPICSVKVARDMLSHIMIQHAHLFKLQRRRRLCRVGIPNSQSLSLFGRDLREAHLQVLLGGVGLRSNNNNNNNNNNNSNNNNNNNNALAANDPFLSSLVLNFAGSEVDEISKSVSSTLEDTTLKNSATTNSWKPSLYSSLSSEERKRRIKQASGRADFMQDLLLCTLLED